VPGYSLRKKEGAAQIDAHDPVERRGRNIKKVTPARRGHPGVVDQTRDRAAPFDDCLHNLGVFRQIGQIALHKQAAPARFGDGLPGLVHTIVVLVGDRDIEALARQLIGDCCTDTAAGAGDNRSGAGVSTVLCSHDASSWP